MITREIRRKVEAMTEAGFTVADIVTAAAGDVTEAEVERIIDDADDRALPHAEPRMQVVFEPNTKRAPRSNTPKASGPVTPRTQNSRSTPGGKGLAPHGSKAAMMRHYRAGEKPCTECAKGRSDRAKAARAAAGAIPRGTATPPRTWHPRPLHVALPAQRETLRRMPCRIQPPRRHRKRQAAQR